MCKVQSTKLVLLSIHSSFHCLHADGCIKGTSCAKGTGIKLVFHVLNTVYGMLMDEIMSLAILLSFDITIQEVLLRDKILYIVLKTHVLW